jgi:SHS family lactate transporter-like MFS transporter
MLSYRQLTSTSIHLSELSPQAFRVFVVGTCYQLGSLAASASSTIESTLGERFPLPPTKSGITRYKYGTVICIFMACVSPHPHILSSTRWLGRESY